MVQNDSCAIWCLLGGGAQQRLAQAGVTLKIATGNLHSNHSYREMEVVQSDRHRNVCFVVSCTRGNAGCSTKTSRGEGVGERAEGLSKGGGVTGRKRGQSDP